MFNKYFAVGCDDEGKTGSCPISGLGGKGDGSDAGGGHADAEMAGD